VSGAKPKLDANFDLYHLIEALSKCHGLVLTSSKYIEKKWGYKISPNTIRTVMKNEGMDDFLDDIRKGSVELCLRKTFDKGIADGDNHCLFYILNQYKQHLDFLEPAKEGVSEAAGEISEYVRYLRGKGKDGASRIELEAATGIPEQRCQD